MTGERETTTTDAPAWRDRLTPGAIAGRPRVVAHRLMLEASPKLTFALVLLVVAGAAITPLSAVLTGSLVGAVADAAAGAGPRRRVVTTLVAIALVYAVQQVLSPTRDATAEAMTRRVDDRMRSRMMQSMLRPNGIAHLEDPSLQDQLALARGVAWNTTPGYAAQGLVMLWTARLSSLGSLLLVARFRWWLAAVLLAANLVTLRSKRQSFLNMTTIYSAGAEDLRRSGYFRDLALSSQNVKETRVFGLGDWAIRRFDSAWLATMGSVWRERKRGAWLVGAGLGVKAVATLAAFLYTARAATTGGLQLGDAVVVMQALIGTASLSMVLGNPELMVQQGVSAITPALEVERRVGEHSANAINGAASAQSLPERSIVFEGVAFAYPGRDTPVFRSLDLEIPAGRSTAIVGENGAGKTTLVKLLARLYDPSAGRITVDGTPLADLDPESWHRRLAVIFQDFGQYALTAEENVALAAFGSAVDRDVVGRVAARAGIASAVEQWEHGWDSILNRQFDRGVEVSGGQWQRIALARALFAVEAGAQLLILDEPTAQLDVRSEAELYDQFLELTRGLTTVVISHRFSTVRRADRIVVVEQGEVVEIGTHDELLARGGRYADMFLLQASRFAS